MRARVALGGVLAGLMGAAGAADDSAIITHPDGHQCITWHWGETPLPPINPPPPPAPPPSPGQWGWLTAKSLFTEYPTTGMALEYHYRINRKWGVRLAANRVEYHRTTPVGSVAFAEEMAMDSGSLFLDWYPFGGSFHLSGAWVRQQSEVSLIGTPAPQQQFVINGKVYTSAQLGTLQGAIRYRRDIPYAGLGWKWNPAGRWLISVDLGAVFAMDPQVSLASSGATGTLNADLAAATAGFADDVDDYYGIAGVGVGIGF